MGHVYGVVNSERAFRRFILIGNRREIVRSRQARSDPFCNGEFEATGTDRQDRDKTHRTFKPCRLIDVFGGFEDHLRFAST